MKELVAGTNCTVIGWGKKEDKNCELGKKVFIFCCAKNSTLNLHFFSLCSTFSRSLTGRGEKESGCDKKRKKKLPKKTNETLFCLFYIDRNSISVQILIPPPSPPSHSLEEFGFHSEEKPSKC